jgi:hypothetical protein
MLNSSNTEEDLINLIKILLSSSNTSIIINFDYLVESIFDGF